MMMIPVVSRVHKDKGMGWIKSRCTAFRHSFVYETLTGKVFWMKHLFLDVKVCLEFCSNYFPTKNLCFSSATNSVFC